MKLLFINLLHLSDTPIIGRQGALLHRVTLWLTLGSYGRFELKVGHIEHKWNKSVVRRNVRKSDLMSHLWTIWPTSGQNMTYLNIGHPNKPGMSGLIPNWVRLDPISVLFGSASQNVLKSVLKKSQNCPIWSQTWNSISTVTAALMSA